MPRMHYATLMVLHCLVVKLLSNGQKGQNAPVVLVAGLVVLVAALVDQAVAAAVAEAKAMLASVAVKRAIGHVIAPSPRETTVVVVAAAVTVAAVAAITAAASDVAEEWEAEAEAEAEARLAEDRLLVLDPVRVRHAEM